MKRSLLIALGIGLLATAAWGQPTGVDGTAHDLVGLGGGTTTQICAYCHTPHQPTGQSTDPLWNHTLSANGTYNTYDSTTFDAGTGGAALNTIADIGGGTGVSNLCMSCHDNTIAIESLYNAPNDGTAGTIGTINGLDPNANMGTDLSNDHPINFTYDSNLETADGGLADPTVAPVSNWLFGGTMQSASCHDPHDNQFGLFLIADNTNSALCSTCHDNK